MSMPQLSKKAITKIYLAFLTTGWPVWDKETAIANIELKIDNQVIFNGLTPCVLELLDFIKEIK